MQATDCSGLLAQYVENASDEAFAALVAQHVHLVYSVALRQVGNPHQAEEITQAVFIILAQKARFLRHEKVLSSWLFQTARLTANNVVRSEMRRQHREQEACAQSALEESSNDIWHRIAPILDAAVAALAEKDRRAIVLRFYEGRTLREVGTALGASDDAAQTRVGRALERLRRYFSQRGVSSTTALLAGAISANCVQPAPAALAATVTALATAKGAAASASNLTLIKGALNLMAWTKAKTTIVVGAALVLAGGTTTILLQSLNRSLPVSLQYNCTLDQDTASGEPSVRPNDLRHFPAGRREFGHVPFSVYGKLQLASRFPKSREQFPARAEVMKADKEFRALHILHGTSYSARDGAPIAELVLHYKDGSQSEIPIRYGWHVRDWTFRGSPQGDWAFGRQDPPPLKPGNEVAWIGSNPLVAPKGEKIRVYKSTFRNPHPNKVVASIDYVSAMTDCSPFLLGLSLQ
jgi:RNA polymerase sigma factor (sigma-70 family)